MLLSPLQSPVLAARLVNISPTADGPAWCPPCNRCGPAAVLESRPARCRRWHQPSHYISKGHVPSPRCPGTPGWPQLSAGRGAGRRALREGGCCGDRRTGIPVEQQDGRLLDGTCSCGCGVRRRFLQSPRPVVLRRCS